MYLMQEQHSGSFTCNKTDAVIMTRIMFGNNHKKMTDSAHLTFIDLFAGAGGFGLGFKLSGYQCNCSLEIDDWAADEVSAVYWTQASLISNSNGLR